MHSTQWKKIGRESVSTPVLCVLMYGVVNGDDNLEDAADDAAEQWGLGISRHPDET